jgi:hypothetical protein
VNGAETSFHSLSSFNAEKYYSADSGSQIVAMMQAAEPFHVLLIQNDDMVEQVTATIANPALSDIVLPGTAEAGSFGMDAKAPYCCARTLSNLSPETGSMIVIPAEIRSHPSQAAALRPKRLKLILFPASSQTPGCMAC